MCWLVGGERGRGACRACGVGEGGGRQELSGSVRLGRCRSIVPHVLFKGAVVAEGIVTARRLFVKEAVEASWGAVAWDGGVWAPAVSGIVFRLKVSALPADPAPFIGSGVAGAGVYIVSE
jgi:hypothetical protein